VSRDELLRRVDTLRNEIARIDAVIAEVDSAVVGGSKDIQLSALRNLRSLRERELAEVTVQLGPG
jgi:hypothetical protein